MTRSEKTENTKTKKPARKAYKLARLFIKTIMIIICSFFAVTASGALIYRALIKPPVIPVMAAEYDPKATPGQADVTPQPSSEGPGAASSQPAVTAAPGKTDANTANRPLGETPPNRKDQFYTFLIFGLDESYNTDTIMVGSYDAVNQEANIISIPRDTKSDVNRYMKKINAAYGAGTLNGGGPEGGVAQLKRELKNMLGFEPDFYACVNLKAFSELVDAAGGVDVDVPFTMKYDDPAQNLHINISKGEQHLSGAEALEFARYRKGNNSKNTISDYQRIENQQAVINAVLDSLLKPASIVKISQFIDLFQKYVKSDMTPANMLWFADQLHSIKGTDALAMYTIPTREDGGAPPMYYELLDKPAVVDLINKTVNPYKADITAGELDIAGP